MARISAKMASAGDGDGDEDGDDGDDEDGDRHEPACVLTVSVASLDV